ncbi:hypothetical protein I6A81_35475 [Frankia sp. CN7]|uniref:MinD/ParA family ATP-binding protein n=2 Tax=Frankia nepalensis TaxID=1836974 RepID=UPI0019345B4B|nr:hypothetical protein [Frankia nepalensis]MBL7501469.1 hypothetical protein [Frankia nepalensis]
MRVAPVTGDDEDEPTPGVPRAARSGGEDLADPVSTAGGGGDARPVSLLGVRLTGGGGDRAVVRRPSSRARGAAAGSRRDGDRRLTAIPGDAAAAARPAGAAGQGAAGGDVPPPGRATAPPPRPAASPPRPAASPPRPAASPSGPAARAALPAARTALPAAPAAPAAPPPVRTAPPAIRPVPAGPPPRPAAEPDSTGPVTGPAPRGASGSEAGRQPAVRPAPAGGGWVPDVGLVPAPAAPPRGAWWDPLGLPLPAGQAGAPGPAATADLATADLAAPAVDPAAAATDPPEPPAPDDQDDLVDQSGYAAWLGPRPAEPSGRPMAGQGAKDAPAAAEPAVPGPAVPGPGGDESGEAGPGSTARADAAEPAASPVSPRAWFGYGEPPRPPFPPPGESTTPVVYTPAPAPRPAAELVPPRGGLESASRPAPLEPARPESPRAYQILPGDTWSSGQDDHPGAAAALPAKTRQSPPLACPGAFTAAWLRGLELAGKGILAPVPSTRLGGRRVLVGGFGGGSGRTTVAAGLGMALAALRGGRVVAVDACPDQGGPLADRAGVPGRGVGLRELAAADPRVASLAEVRRFLATAQPSGLEVLPGLRDLTAPGLTPAEAAWAVDLLGRLFPVVVIDGPPGWTQPVPAVLLARADTVVLAAKAGLTEAGCAQDALTALAAARADLPDGAVVVHVETTPSARNWARPAPAQPPALVEPVHAVVTIPYDPALAGGVPPRWDRLRSRTRAAFDELAEIVDAAPLDPRPPSAEHRAAGALPGPPGDLSEDPTVPRPRDRSRSSGSAW